MAKPFHGFVIEINMSQLDFVLRQRVDINRKAMILTGDFNFLCKQIHHGMVSSPVAKFEFVGFPPESQPKNLVPQANPKHRDFTDQFSGGLNKVSHSRRVAGTIRKENAVRLIREDLFAGESGRNNGDAKTVLIQFTKNISFDPPVNTND